jgi:diacylglycerol kinase family enzyme
MKPQPSVTVLLNASSGTLHGADGGRLRESVAAAFGKHAIAAKLELLAAEELHAAAQRALEQATDGDSKAIVVGGGDGSIRTVAGVLAGREIVLGIIPLGTLNHFAKDLGIPLRLDEAVAVIAAGKTRSVDVGEVNGEVFVNNSSIGLYPYMLVDRERRRSSSGHSKWTAMLLAVLRALWYFPLRRLAIYVQGRSEPWRTPLVFIGNNEYVLSGLAVGNRQRLDGGELVLYVARKQSRLSLFWLACRSILGALDQERDLRVLKATAADIRSRTSRLLIACDGEVEMMRPPLRYRSKPGALRVFAPPRPQIQG